ncbi:Satratoxin biosynthesis SC1 cluster protein 4 [Colletotrichum sidae]|uniref:Satratoxin biosynthesis SC1 cluster protein 4 n=1 Tax=Colletotrichum sidae TaxID=1347389 RepID=A0A4R8TSY4_9PEZI|nr:Satratoxin biosynthesis SC1 cluster protein 4 [Colletotrichum sidae]
MDYPWLAPVPEGQVRHEVNPPHMTSSLLAGAFATTCVATVTVFMRLFTRLYVVRTRLNIDDYFVTISAIFAWALAFIILKQIQHGAGYHMWDILYDNYNIWFPIYTTCATIIYALSISFSKLSVLFLYLRLSPQLWFRRGVWFLITTVTCYSIVYVFMSIFSCKPIRASWDLSIPVKEVVCLDKLTVYISLSVANIVMDILILLLPIPVVVPLQMAKRQKISLILLFGTGAFVCGVAIKRTVGLPGLVGSTDYCWDAVPQLNLSYLEVNAGIICASVPALKPFFMRYLPAFISSRISSNKGGRSSMSGKSGRGLNTVVQQNMERRRRQDESLELSSHDGKKTDEDDNDEAKLWTGYQNVKSALCNARESPRRQQQQQQHQDIESSSVDTIDEMTGPRKGERSVTVSAMGCNGECKKGATGIMVKRETTVSEQEQQSKQSYPGGCPV